MITFQSFQDSLSQEAPPAQLPLLLRALWYEAKGNWDRAHTIADGEGGPHGDWIHAYLHRVEGDQWNADYWYRRAGRSRPNLSLKEEWEMISRALLVEMSNE